MDAFKVSFEFYVFAENLDDASTRVKAWRPLALASGFDPGAGSVKKATDREVGSIDHLAQALAGARRRLLATERERSQATRGLSRHMGGDLEHAEEMLASIERASGPLQKALAVAFGGLA